MKIFPFTTLRSASPTPSVIDIAKPLLKVSIYIGLAVGGFRALSAHNSIYTLVIGLCSTTIGGFGFTALFYAFTKTAHISGYRPFLFTVDQPTSAVITESKIQNTLTDFGFKKEDEDRVLGTVWVLSSPAKDRELFMKSNFPLRAYIFRNGLLKDGNLSFLLQIKGTPIWDTGETAYLQEIGHGIIELSQTA